MANVQRMSQSAALFVLRQVRRGERLEDSVEVDLVAAITVRGGVTLTTVRCDLSHNLYAIATDGGNLDDPIRINASDSVFDRNRASAVRLISYDATLSFQRCSFSLNGYAGGADGVIVVFTSSALSISHSRFWSNQAEAVISLAGALPSSSAGR